MAKLSNTPKQTLTFDLERRKSYTFRVALKYGDGLPVDLTGSQVTFVMKESALDDDPYDQLNQIVHSAAEIGDPASGVGVFFFQAAELDGPSGEYPYAITLISAEGFSTVVCKGTVNLLDNTEAMSMYHRYTGVSPSNELELTLRGGDVVNLQINSLPRDPSINSSWVDLPLLGTWQVVDRVPAPRGLSSAGITYLSGAAAGTIKEINSPILRLPQLLRPRQPKILASVGPTGSVVLTIDTNGFVTPLSYSNPPAGPHAGIYLDSLIFPNS